MSVTETRYGQNVLQPVSQSVGRGDREEWRGGGGRWILLYMIVLYNIDTPITESHASYTHTVFRMFYLSLDPFQAGIVGS